MEAAALYLRHGFTATDEAYATHILPLGFDSPIGPRSTQGA